MPKDVTKSAIDEQIHMIRGLSVIRRNRNRFPADFMFQLNKQEVTNLSSRIATSNLARGYGGRRRKPVTEVRVSLRVFGPVAGARPDASAAESAGAEIR